MWFTSGVPVGHGDFLSSGEDNLFNYYEIKFQNEFIKYVYSRQLLCSTRASSGDGALVEHSN